MGNNGVTHFIPLVDISAGGDFNGVLDTCDVVKHNRKNIKK